MEDEFYEFLFIDIATDVMNHIVDLILYYK